ncbi:MAG TPA: hypothetical protein VLP43_12265 [Solirubrobacteraceae bacterium]|nr:hypothetical protein [Solirubrobacteraceae bacterium]
MRRLALIFAVLTALAAPVALVEAGAGAPAAPHSQPVLLAFRGGFHFGGGGFGTRRYGSGGFLSRGRSSRFGRTSFLHRLVRYAAIAYFLHLFFTHGGLSIILWLIIIGLVVMLFHRRRRRAAARYSY